MGRVFGLLHDNVNPIDNRKQTTAELNLIVIFYVCLFYFIILRIYAKSKTMQNIINVFIGFTQLLTINSLTLHLKLLQFIHLD